LTTNDNNPNRYLALSTDGADLITASQQSGITYWQKNPVSGFFIVQQYKNRG
jgi:hypothetical protein